MKKIIFLILISVNFLYAGFTWSQIQSWSNKTIKPDAKYNVETEGYNVRVYEFTPASDPGSTCIMTFTNEKMGMFCFAKSEEALRKEE